MASKGGKLEDKQKEEDEKKRKLKSKLESFNTGVIHAETNRMQVMRHKTSHLGPMENISLKEVERLRLEQDAQLKKIEI